MKPTRRNSAHTFFGQPKAGSINTNYSTLPKLTHSLSESRGASDLFKKNPVFKEDKLSYLSGTSNEPRDCCCVIL